MAVPASRLTSAQHNKANRDLFDEDLALDMIIVWGTAFLPSQERGVTVLVGAAT